MVRGLVKFLSAVAYLFCLALPGSCLTRFANLFSLPCIRLASGSLVWWTNLSLLVNLFIFAVIYALGHDDDGAFGREGANHYFTT